MVIFVCYFCFVCVLPLPCSVECSEEDMVNSSGHVWMRNVAYAVIFDYVTFDIYVGGFKV